MARIHIVTEGATEKNFVDDVLKQYLANKGIYVDAHSVTTRRDRKRNRNYRGGLDNINHLIKDVKIWLLESQNLPGCWVTTMVDLYSFPYHDRPDWIADFESQHDGLHKALFLENKLKDEFLTFKRFIPYIQLHEYETLLLVNTASIHSAFFNLYNANTLKKLNADIAGYTPEEINQGQHSSPSKRIISHYPLYDDDKPVWGSLIAQDIGIEPMRQACPHFNDWITMLENIA